jgi:adenylate cyclase
MIWGKSSRPPKTSRNFFQGEGYAEELIISPPGARQDATCLDAGLLDPVGSRPITATDFGLSAQPMPSAKLLAVDDDPMNRDMLARRLDKLGYEVTDAANGREALQKLKDGNFDLVLLDILMPDLDGFQTLEFMKADPRLRHVPVIMLTALDDVASTVRCIEAGAEDYVPKPFNPTVLRARISASLEKKRLRDQEQAFLAQLQVERAKSERLLLNVLPKAIAERLKAGQRTIVDSFIDSTVLFADIVGFTRIASRQSPHRTVQLLNELFSGFDRIAEQRELEKVKTIGDAYMLAGGVPVNRPDHAEACTEAAFEFLEAVKVFNRRHSLDWAIRIGMNSGPVVAGHYRHQEIFLRPLGRHREHRQPHGIPRAAGQDPGLGGDPQAPRGQIRVHPCRRHRDQELLAHADLSAHAKGRQVRERRLACPWRPAARHGGLTRPGLTSLASGISGWSTRAASGSRTARSRPHAPWSPACHHGCRIPRRHNKSNSCSVSPSNGRDRAHRPHSGCA